MSLETSTVPILAKNGILRKRGRGEPFARTTTALSYSAACFLGSGMVWMGDGSRKRVDMIRKGDIVNGGHVVLCVTKTYVVGGLAEIVRLGNPSSGGWTPNHPVRYGETWYLPGDIQAEHLEVCEAVYNFVLESGHILTIGEIETCTIGHQFEGPVVEHPFFGRRVKGTPHMLDILEKDPNYGTGLVVWSDVLTCRDTKGYVSNMEPGYIY